MTVPDLQRLPWDSSFLGFPVGQVVVPRPGAATVSAAIAQAQQLGLQLTYLLLDPTDAKAATAARRAGAILVDRKVTFSRSVMPDARPVPSTGTSVAQMQQYSTELEQLAWESGKYSRFRVDPNFTPCVFEQLYSRWLRASLDGELARAVFACLDANGHPTGLLTLQPHGAVANIGLLAVQAEARGQGQGRMLIDVAQHTAWEWGCSMLRVTTQQDNEPACRFYAHCGFTVEQVVHVYHLWHNARAV